MENKEKQTKSELLKKFWFVGLVCIALIVFIVLYIRDYSVNKPVEIEQKQVDGEYVIFDVDGENYFAKDLFETMNAGSGLSREYNEFSTMVLNKAYKTTSEMDTKANSMSNYYIQMYGQEQLEASLLSMGYTNGISDLPVYYVTYFKNIEMLREYYTAHYDEFVQSFVDESVPKKLSHILVQVADVEEVRNDDGTYTHIPHPTDEEQAKLDAVIEALKTSDFETVAKQYSDDGSKDTGGLLGIYTNDMATSSFVTEFADASVNNEPGTVTEAFASQYGYHILKVDAPTKEEIMADDNIINAINNKYQNKYTAILMEKANEVGFEIIDEKLQKQIDIEVEAANDEGSEE